ncbi:MAG: DoxX family protein [Bacteroidales bacterium]
MNTKTRNTINWVLAGLVAFIFFGSAAGKLTGSADAIKMAEGFGISAGAFTFLGVVELIAVILFVIPRTGILGALLLAAYMGGAVASHLEHNLSIVAPVIISAFVWIVAVIRYPELTQRIRAVKD